jgi:outer membrane receptor for ferrienterochelin and colicin
MNAHDLTRIFLLAGASSLALSLPAFAASGLQIHVVNAQGKPVSAVSVEVDSSVSGYHKSVATDQNGQARLDGLSTSGVYRITVQGNETYDGATVDGVELRSNDDRSVTLSLNEKGATVVVVQGKKSVTSINTVNAEISASLSARELQALPIEGRDVVRALVRLPNVVPSTGFFPEAPVISVNGANGLYVNYLIDGLDNNENFLGGPKFPVPLGFTKNVTVLANSYSSVYGRTNNGVVNYTTPSGTNELHGEVYALARPGRPIDAKSPFPLRDLSGNTVSESFARYQSGFSLSGPIVKDRTFFYVNLESTREDNDNVLDAPVLNSVGNVKAKGSGLLGSFRLDHRLNDQWSLALRGNAGDISIDRPGGALGAGSVQFPSAGSDEIRKSSLLAASASYSNGNLSYEGAVQYSQFRWDYARPKGASGPQVSIRDNTGLTIGVVGHPGFVFNDLEKTWQTQHRLQYQAGDHRFSVGADIIVSDFSLLGGGNPDGNYTVELNSAQITQLNGLNRGQGLNAADVLALNPAVLNYSVELRPQSFGTTQTLSAFYAEDEWHINAKLTATLGLRWDYDSLTKKGSGKGDTDNFAPRFSLNYRPDSQSAIRFGAGTYYSKIPYTIISDSLQQNTTSAAFLGQLQQLKTLGLIPQSTDLSAVTFDGNLSVNPTCATVSACPTPAQAQGLRDTAVINGARILNPNGYESPFSTQFSLGYERQWSDKITVSADIIYSRSYNLIRLRDLNAPAAFSPNLANLTDANIALLRAQPDTASRLALAQSLGLVRTVAQADATRPVAPVAGGAKEITVSETEGSSNYGALNLQVNKAKGTDRYSYRVSYTLSKLTNNTDDLNFRASNANNFSADVGPSANDRRHVVSAVVYLYPIENLSISVAGLYQSGQPINFVPDASVFGTQDLNGDGQSFGATFVGNSDRYPGVGRNTGRLKSSTTIDLGLRYDLPLKGGHVEFTADMFNVFNTNNQSGFANAATTSNQTQFGGNAPFIQRTAAPPRQVQFGVAWKF